MLGLDYELCQINAYNEPKDSGKHTVVAMSLYSVGH